MSDLVRRCSGVVVPVDGSMRLPRSTMMGVGVSGVHAEVPGVEMHDGKWGAYTTLPYFPPFPTYLNEI